MGHGGEFVAERPGRGGGGPPAAARLPSLPVVTDLIRNAVDVLPEGELERKLALGRPLRVKLGIDPTTADIHLGHTVVLGKLREFQDAGHKVVLIIGDATARVGDPSGRSKARPFVSGEEIDANARTYQEQAMKVLRDDPELLEIRHNSEWLDMPMEDFLRLARTTTVAQILERDDFARRWTAREPITVLETLYPLLQGYDSVEIDADVEIGGTDQKFNLLLGRDIQRYYGRPEQAVLTLPLLVGIDGADKMSKSLGNYVGVAEPPEEMYGKTMRIPDELLEQWYRLLLLRQPPADASPRDAKRALARALVERYHGAEAARAAEAHFDRLFVERAAPDDVPEAAFSGDPVHLPAVLGDAFAVSRSEVRRVIAQGGVRVDGQAVDSDDVPAALLDGQVVRMGKRRFVRLRRADGS
jgi:tyrosyl-tRNA synthetase